jgi:hypothetical protein
MLLLVQRLRELTVGPDVGPPSSIHLCPSPTLMARVCQSFHTPAKQQAPPAPPSLALTETCVVLLLPGMCHLRQRLGNETAKPSLHEALPVRGVVHLSSINTWYSIRPTQPGVQQRHPPCSSVVCCRTCLVGAHSALTGLRSQHKAANTTHLVVTYPPRF